MASTYNINEYKNPLFTVDSVLFTVTDNTLKVLLVKRASAPFEGRWALPGGFVNIDNDKDTTATALRKLKEKTNVEPPYLEQLRVFSGLGRDPRGFSVTLVYFALTEAQQVASHIDSIEEVQWVDIGKIEVLPMAFDHQAIVEQAKERLKQKTLYSMLPVYCLAEQFTIGQLKATIEAIIGKPIQRKSLIRRVESSNMFDVLEDKVQSGGRLAQQYKLKVGANIVNFERNLAG
jgi:ADP-ribose pyrophosphatase YjhB (NUDIX family)